MVRSSYKTFKKWLPILSIGLLGFVQFSLDHHLATNHGSHPHSHGTIEEHHDSNPLSDSAIAVVANERQEQPPIKQVRTPVAGHHHPHGSDHHTHDPVDKAAHPHTAQVSHSHAVEDVPDPKKKASPKPGQDQASAGTDHPRLANGNVFSETTPPHSGHDHHPGHDHHHEDHSQEHELAPILLKRTQHHAYQNLVGIIERRSFSLPFAQVMNRPLIKSETTLCVSLLDPSQPRAPPLSTSLNIVS